MAEKILIVEDEPVVAEDIRLTIEQAGYEFCGIAPSVNRALELVKQQKPCLVLVDIFLKGNLSGLDLAFELNEKDIPFVYLSTNYDHEIMEVAKRTQPYGFLVKPIRKKDLLIALDIAHYRWEQKSQLKFQSTKASIDKKVNHRPDNKYFFEARNKTLAQKGNAFEGMEVHHHPNVEKKGLKEYILEGLMIFLAVSMGFIAENIREHVTEHKNAKILAESMLEDIKKDTASLNNIIEFSSKKIDAADSILAIVHRPRNKWNNVDFYKNMVPILTSVPFAPTDSTYAQMKTSGSLRYFNQSLVNLMNAYDVQLKKTEYRDNVEDKGIWILANLNFDIMNLEVLSELRFNKPIQHDMYIKIDDKINTDKFINLIVMNKIFRTRSQMEYEEQQKIAVKLITALQKEYQLE